MSSVGARDDVMRMRMRKAHHLPECTTVMCFCFDKDFGDPMCACGHAAWDCRCPDLPEDQTNDDPYDDFLAADGFAHPWDGEDPSR